MTQRKSFDLDHYMDQIQHQPCFICAMVRGELNGNYVIYQDERIIVFLNKYPTLYGYTVLAPVAHKEQVTGEFSLDEYVALQAQVYWVAEAVRRSVATERLYLLSLGSQQGNRHVHWHIAPLPPGVPLKEQQLEALRIEGGVLDLGDAEMHRLARRIRDQMELVR